MPKDTPPAKKLTIRTAREQARAVIDRNRIGEKFSEEDTHEFSRVTGCDFTAVMRDRNPSYPSDPRFIRVWGDGREGEGFSWNNAIRNMLGKPVSEYERIAKALRNAIRPDIEDFRSTAPDACEHCGTNEKLAVDHDFPPFSSIVKEFIWTRPPIELEDRAEGQGKTIASADVEADWIAFHAQHASLKILCRSCNSSKGTHREPWRGGC